MMLYIIKYTDLAGFMSLKRALFCCFSFILAPPLRAGRPLERSEDVDGSAR